MVLVLDTFEAADVIVIVDVCHDHSLIKHAPLPHAIEAVRCNAIGVMSIVIRSCCSSEMHLHS